MLKKVRLVALISLLAMFVPLSMDLYLPALPQMMLFFNTNELLLNSTLYVFYLFMAIGMLFVGSLSDRYGRKTVLLPCAAAYSVASICCIFTISIWQLVLLRALQALGVGALMSISTAIIKDAFEGDQRESILGISQAMSLVAPMVAPILGAFILQYFTWQIEFAVLSAFGILVMALALVQEETLAPDQRTTLDAFGTFRHLGGVLHNKSFTCLMIATSIAPIGYMAYVSASSYIYQNQFAVSELQYGLFYSINATVTVCASLAYIKIRRDLKPTSIMAAILIMITLSGASLVVIGDASPIVFLLCFLPNAFFCTTLKPFSTSLLLEQQENEIGAAASLLNFTQTAFSCLGLILGSIPWVNMVLGLGLVVLISSLLAVAGWIFVVKSPNIHIRALEKNHEMDMD